MPCASPGRPLQALHKHDGTACRGDRGENQPLLKHTNLKSACTIAHMQENSHHSFPHLSAVTIEVIMPFACLHQPEHTHTYIYLYIHLLYLYVPLSIGDGSGDHRCW